MILVRAALGDHIHDGARGAAVLRRELIGDQPELLDDVRIVDNLLAAGDAGVVGVLSINDEVVAARARAVHGKVCARSKGRVAAVELADARRGERKGEHVAEPTSAADAARRVCRQVRNSLGVETHADFGIGSV